MERPDVQKVVQVFRLEFRGLVPRALPVGSRRRRYRPRVGPDHHPQHQVRRRVRLL